MLKVWTTKLLDSVGHLAATHPAHEVLVKNLGVDELSLETQVVICVAVLILAWVLKLILNRVTKNSSRR